MSWTVILSALVSAVLSAGLVFLQGWAPLHAFGVVVLAIEGLSFTLLAGLLLSVARNERSELWRVFTSAIKRDLGQVAVFLRLRNAAQ